MSEIMNAFSFGVALDMLKEGKLVQRTGWNGKGMYLYYTGNGTCDDTQGLRQPLLPFIVMKTADNKMVPWLASQTDILADDWRVFEPA